MIVGQKRTNLQTLPIRHELGGMRARPRLWGKRARIYRLNLWKEGEAMAMGKENKLTKAPYSSRNEGGPCS